jgi:S-disulfanyl-L-cysteine oxidoreductase SoxD
MGALVLMLRAQTSSPPPSRSVWDGIYTAKQTERGQALYQQQCSSCHGEKLAGKKNEASPPLAGPDFQEQWNGRTVDDLFKKIIRNMPQDDPGTLTPQQSADLVAFILSFNKYPAGDAELPVSDESLAAIRIEAKKPDAK